MNINNIKYDKVNNTYEIYATNIDAKNFTIIHNELYFGVSKYNYIIRKKAEKFEWKRSLEKKYSKRLLSSQGCLSTLENFQLQPDGHLVKDGTAMLVRRSKGIFFRNAKRFEQKYSLIYARP